MRVLHIGTNETLGGAARAAYRLHTGLRPLGHDSIMLVAHKQSGDPTVEAFTPSVGIARRLRRLLRRGRIARSLERYESSRPAGYEPFSGDRSEHGATLVRQLPSCDVINLHWVAGFVDYRSFFRSIPRGTPVVWTLHDMNPFTGGCHYDDGCGKFAEYCGACPQLGSSAARDLSREIWQRKRRVFQGVPKGGLHIVTPSRWLARQVRRSPLLRDRPVSVIPNGLDTQAFSPRDRRSAREVLGVPPEAKVVLFVAQWTGIRRKGFRLLLEALAGLSSVPNLLLMSLGVGGGSDDIGIPHVHFDRTDDDRLLALVYSAADLFVIPSLQDNLPNTVMEAMSCGTPVVGLDVGGIPDMVRPGTTGSLVPPGDVKALGAAIAGLLEDDPKRREMARNCRRIAVEEYSLEVQARRYVELYERMLAGEGP